MGKSLRDDVGLVVMKIYEVTGGTLTAAVLATKLALSGRTVRLQLIEENVLVSGWKSWAFGEIRTNNGFHAIDVTRAPGLVHLLNVQLGLSLALDSRPSGVIIDGWLGELGSHPDGFNSGFSNDATTYLATLSQLDADLGEEARAMFQLVGMRYGDSWTEAMEFMIPWFLPSNVLLDSPDEGDQYRNLLRSGLAIQQRAVPKNGIFENLGSEWLAKIVEIGVDVVYVAKEKKTPAGPPSEGYRNFHISVFETDSVVFDRFAETIVAWREASELARISTFRSENEHKYVLVESHHIPPALPETEKWQDLFQSLDADASFQAIASEHTRTIPKNSTKMMGPSFDISDRGVTVSVEFSSQGPINMAKVYQIALSAFLQIENRE